MCDQDHFEEDLNKYSRRDFNTLAAAGLSGLGAAIFFHARQAQPK